MFPEQDKDFENKNEPIPAEELFADLLSELDEYDDILIEDIKKERELEQREEEQNFQAHKDAMNATIAEVMEELEEIANLPKGVEDDRDIFEITNKIKFNVGGKPVGFMDVLAESLYVQEQQAIGLKADKLVEATKIYTDLVEVFGNDVKTDTKPALGSGSVYTNLDHVFLSRYQLDLIRDVCASATTFSIYPLTTKQLEVAATIKNLIQYADRP